MSPIVHTSSVLRLVALLSAALLATVLPPAGAQEIFLGKCPEQDVVQNFNVSAYSGKWYEHKRYFAFFELGAKCVTAVFTDEGNETMGAYIAQTYRIFGRTITYNGTITVVGEDGEAKLEARFPSVGNFPAPYCVLDTDYTNYSIEWSCTSVLGVSNFQFAWVLTRARNPSEEVMAMLKEALDKRHLAERYFINTPQDCDDN